MSDYVPDLDPNLIAAVKEELQKKQQIQQLHYFYISQLQAWSQELKPPLRQTLSQEILCSLTQCLLDGTVFDIIKSLREVQHLEEKKLFNDRNSLVAELKQERSEMQDRHAREEHRNLHRSSHLGPLRQRQAQEWARLMHAHDERLKRIDMKIILQLDQKVLNQQVTLEKAGLPLFFATNRGEDIAVQMKIIEYIIRLSQITPRPFEGVARSA